MVAVKVTITGLDSMRQAVNNLAGQIQIPDDKLMRRIGDAMLEDTDRRFMSRGYGTWQEDSPETIRRKGHGMVLIDSGAMMASTKIQRIGNALRLVVRYGGKNHNPDVPGYHQEGGRHMPQRKIVAVTPQLTSLLAATLAVWIRDLVKAFAKKV